LFLSVNEIFSSRLDQVITDLVRYDYRSDSKNDSTSAIHLLARARAVLAVNPALAVSRVRAFRQEYGLTDIIPILLSKTATDPEIADGKLICPPSPVYPPDRGIIR
jgi:hypothetical protein